MAYSNDIFLCDSLADEARVDIDNIPVLTVPLLQDCLAPLLFFVVVLSYEYLATAHRCLLVCGSSVEEYARAHARGLE